MAVQRLTDAGFAIVEANPCGRFIGCTACGSSDGGIRGVGSIVQICILKVRRFTLAGFSLSEPPEQQIPGDGDGEVGGDGGPLDEGHVPFAYLEPGHVRFPIN